jgi:hypothetical protein
MANVETEGFNDAIESTEDFIGAIRDPGGEMQRHVNEEVNRLKGDIKSEIQRQGLVDTGALLESWSTNPSYYIGEAHWSIRSSADYSKALAGSGADEHIIRPNKKRYLAWSLDDTELEENDLDISRGLQYDPETNKVIYVSSSGRGGPTVDHPGTDPTYYVSGPQQIWWRTVGRKLRAKITSIAAKSGFKPV